jgi:hypothetical protein
VFFLISSHTTTVNASVVFVFGILGFELRTSC